MRDRRVEQRPSQLGAQGVADLEAAVGEHVLRGGRQPQIRVGDPPSKADPWPSTLHPAVDLHSKPVRQSRLCHQRRPSATTKRVT